jgi:imidazolonepropionase-like amidohydrolase
MPRYVSVIVLFVLISAGLRAQGTFPVNGTSGADKSLYALTNASLYVDYKTFIPNATLLFRDGKIIQADSGVKIPANAVVRDLKGAYVYPSFIDPFAEYGIQELKYPENRMSEYLNSRSGAWNWNETVHPEWSAADVFQPSAVDAEAFRKAGIGYVLTAKQDGVIRGSAAFVSTGTSRTHEELLIPRAAALFSFEKGSARQNYPSSLTGTIALIRQTYYDARWYSAGGRDKERNLSLEAFLNNEKLVRIFECKDTYDLFRAAAIAKEFGVTYVLKGTGTEYRRVKELKSLQTPVILPLDFPEVMDVSDPYDARMVSLADLKHWELAPYNAAMVAAEGIPFAFTTRGLKDKSQFLSRIRRAVSCGLSTQAALKALTYEPARILRAEKVSGALKPGMPACFFISSGSVFAEKSQITDHYIHGVRYISETSPVTDIRGSWILSVRSLNFPLKISGELLKPAGEITINDTVKVKCDIRLNGALVTLTTSYPGNSGMYRLSGLIDAVQMTFSGKGESPEGQSLDWSAQRTAAAEKVENPEVKADTLKPGAVWFPFNAFGATEVPTQKEYLIRNATVWTGEAEGILKETDVWVSGGKIRKIGKNLQAPGAVTIDGTGKHLTAGIIDEHSHIAMTRGVNEFGNNVSSEVRMGDVIHSDDINIYRHLAGGVTACQLLHGSANPSGGQSALVKMHWGVMPDQMKIPYAQGYIKFALGENVKQSNWGNSGWRYPQSRPGVEQTYLYYFTEAKAYEQALKSNPEGTRRDLRLDAFVEILNSKRFITCHSYVQSEINMLMKLADSLGFKVNTFTHILEGYKVADKMAKHGVAASTFSDWWAYKWEVNDAIPYNAALMTKVGVLTAMNSDDAEMARRLNQEAAKAVKYGGIPEEEAWKMVTINPAKMLRLDKQTGSIREGKDADLVLWTGNPLSVYTAAQSTWVDGILYFDMKRDAELRQMVAAERNRIIQKMLKSVNGQGGQAPKPQKKMQHLYDCEDRSSDDFD